MAAGLHPALKERIGKDFPPEQRQQAIDLLSQIKPRHVMGGSEFNLNNTRAAALQVAAGDLAELKRCVAMAQLDFRDVIMMASGKPD